jgi:hypothetical protein
MDYHGNGGTDGVRPGLPSTYSPPYNWWGASGMVIASDAAAWPYQLGRVVSLDGGVPDGTSNVDPRNREVPGQPSPRSQPVERRLRLGRWVSTATPSAAFGQFSPRQDRPARGAANRLRVLALSADESCGDPDIGWCAVPSQRQLVRLGTSGLVQRRHGRPEPSQDPLHRGPAGPAAGVCAG